jgi:hypothetical protein
MFSSKNRFFTNANASGYQLTRSLRFRASATAYLNRTFGTPTSTTIWTWSAWLKRGGLGGTYRLFGASTSTYLTFNTSDQINLTLNGVSAATSTAVFRDPSSWYHIVYQQNGSAQTIYVNNSSVATGTTAASIFNTAISHQIAAANTTNYFDGYLGEINFIDGQALTPSSFGQTDSTTGVWVPKKYTGTYGNNGFYLPLTDTSSTTNLVKDSSGNANNWTPNNISLTAGVTYDSMIDVPYCTGQTGGTQPSGNYAVLNPLNYFSIPAAAPNTVVDGNLNATMVVGTYYNASASSIALPSTGKFYCEIKYASGGTNGGSLGIFSNTYAGTIASAPCFGVDWNASAQYVMHNGTNSSSADANCPSAAGQTIAIAVDMGAGKIWIGSDRASAGTIAWMNSGSPASGTNPLISISGAGGLYTDWTIGTNIWYFAVTGAYTGGQVMQANFGQRAFLNSPPSGFNALCAPNLASPTILNGAGYMAATTYTGTGATLNVVDTVGTTSFKPDLVWVKSRSAATDHKLTDSVRGATFALSTDTTSGQTTDTTGVTAFNSNGFTLGANANYNTSAATYVGWQWLAGAGTTSSNSNGSITSTVCVNTTSGFSVVTYTGSGANATVGHGLGIAPSMFFIKNTSTTTSWPLYHTSIPATNYMLLNANNGATTGTSTFNSTAPTSTVFSIGTTTNINSSAVVYVAYCFAAIPGYSAFGSYTGNGSADGPFVYCGFRPRYLLIKRSDVSGNDWDVTDTSRYLYNTGAANRLYPDLPNVEDTGMSLDIVSNGFKLRGTFTDGNVSGGTYIYAAFAENPFNYSLAR